MRREKYLIRNNHPLVYRSGDVIIRDSKTDRLMYRVTSGEVHVEYNGDVYDVVVEGEFLGGIYETATVVAVSDCVLTPLKRV